MLCTCGVALAAYGYAVDDDRDVTIWHIARIQQPTDLYAASRGDVGTYLRADEDPPDHDVADADGTVVRCGACQADIEIGA